PERSVSLFSMSPVLFSSLSIFLFAFFRPISNTSTILFFNTRQHVSTSCPSFIFSMTSSIFSSQISLNQYQNFHDRTFATTWKVRLFSFFSFLCKQTTFFNLILQPIATWSLLCPLSLSSQYSTCDARSTRAQLTAK